MNKNTLPVVETYNLYTGYGQTRRKVRKATKVKFSDGTVIKFIDYLPKKVAIQNAYYQRGKELLNLK